MRIRYAVRALRPPPIPNAPAAVIRPAPRSARLVMVNGVKATSATSIRPSNGTAAANEGPKTGSMVSHPAPPISSAAATAATRAIRLARRTRSTPWPSAACRLTSWPRAIGTSRGTSARVAASE
ncbi:hypothetical protein C8054_11195 [Micromonospora sp. RP3T]|nr:hypothetical protein C8054_11195 [Micromonospora sp. RP3T]